MICPSCKSNMIVVEHKKIELDYCPRCHGVWFDSTELELLLKSMDLDSQNLLLNNILNSPEDKSSEKRRKCPRCRRKMKKTTIGEHPEILVDACPQGHGLWFDSGELTQLLKQLGERPSAKQDSQQQLIGFLSEVFKARG